MKSVCDNTEINSVTFVKISNLFLYMHKNFPQKHKFRLLLDSVPSMNLIAVKQKCRNSSTNSYLVAADGDLTADQILCLNQDVIRIDSYYQS